MSKLELKGKSTIEVEAIEAEAEASRQKIQLAELELNNLRKVIKAHIENTLGVCNDYAKVIVNNMPISLLNVVGDLDEVELSEMFNQKVVNAAFCVTRKGADKDTRKEARTIDLKAREKSQVAFKAAKLELFSAFDKLADKVKPSANKALGLMVEGIKAWPEDINGKSMAFYNDTARQGDYVLIISAMTKYSPEKKD